MKLFGIPISGMMYYVNWKMTMAQLELLAADVSVVDYNYKKDRKKRGKGEYDDTKADSSAVKKAAEQWTEKYGTGEDAGKGLAITDILGTGMRADVGVKLRD